MDRTRNHAETSYSRAVGRNVYALRKARKMTRDAVIAAIRERGVRLTNAALHRIETGRTATGGCASVSVDQLMAFAVFFEVTIDQLLTTSDCTQCHGAPPPGFSCRGCGAIA